MGGDEGVGLAYESGVEAEACASPPEPPPITMSATPILPSLSPLQANRSQPFFDAGGSELAVPERDWALLRESLPCHRLWPTASLPPVS